MHPEARLLTDPEAQATFEAEENQQLECEQVAVRGPLFHSKSISEFFQLQPQTPLAFFRL